MTRALKGASTFRHVIAGQTIVRGGWSGGGRVNPAISGSSNGRRIRRFAWRIGKPSPDGPPGSTLTMQMASNGQSWQSLCFCFSGQHGMSAAIPDASSAIATATTACAAAGVTSGATVRPAVISTASKSRLSRPKSMTHHHMEPVTLGRSRTSRIRHRPTNWLLKDVFSALLHRTTCFSGASARRL